MFVCFVFLRYLDVLRQNIITLCNFNTFYCR